MYRIVVVLLMLFASFQPVRLLAQDEFCEAITAIYRDAPNEFRNVRTYIVESGPGSEIYRSGIAVPGVTGSRFVYSKGRFFEAAVFQTDSVAKLAPYYDKYKNLLRECAERNGLHMNTYENFYPGLAAYRKVVYLPEYDAKTDLKKLSGHMTLEVDFNKLSGLYTIIFYIFEH
jgi:hypothetical protein